MRTPAPTKKPSSSGAIDNSYNPEDGLRFTIGGKITPEDVLDLGKSLYVDRISPNDLLRKWMIPDTFSMLTFEGVAPNDPLFTAALKEFYASGIDVLNIGTLRILDEGMTGLTRTVNAISGSGILPVGAFRTPEEMRNLAMRDYGNGKFKVAFLSYVQEISETGVENTTEVERSYAVKPLDPTIVRQDVVRARSMGAQLVIVNISWADEPTGTEDELLNQVVYSGADIIAGTHPETVDPIELRTVQLSDGTMQTVFVAKSLGNFLAGTSASAPDKASVLITFTYALDKYTGRLNLVTDSADGHSPFYTPTWLAYDEISDVYHVVPAGLTTRPNWMSNDQYTAMHDAYLHTVNLLGSNVATPVAE